MLSEEKKSLLRYYNEGIKLYFGKDFKNAILQFQKALEIDPNDGPSKLQYLRCVEYIKNPPSDDWDGVFTMVSK